MKIEIHKASKFCNYYWMELDGATIAEDCTCWAEADEIKSTIEEELGDYFQDAEFWNDVNEIVERIQDNYKG